jgi:hypothetical protein
MEIAVVYIAEAYQCYHGAALGIELARQPGVKVTSFYAHPDTPRLLDRIHQAFDAPPPRLVPLQQSMRTRLLRGAKYLGKFKHLILRDNREMLDRFDAIVAVENTLAMARDEGITRPRLIYTPHGFGDRAYSFVGRIADFDFVLVAGAKTEAQMLAHRLIRPGDYALTGSIKLETAARLSRSEKQRFDQQRPIILYNPHFDPWLTSWGRFIEPMLRAFGQQQAFNLIAAPHVKMFERATARVTARWRARSTDNIVVDPGSDRSMDASYLWDASVYVGDSSSQVYEFLVQPRPCLFLNAHGVDWRDNPAYAHWHLGDVVDQPDQLMAALGQAEARHPFYRARQIEAFKAAFGDQQGSPSAKGAAAIMRFVSSDGSS